MRCGTVSRFKTGEHRLKRSLSFRWPSSNITDYSITTLLTGGFRLPSPAPDLYRSLEGVELSAWRCQQCLRYSDAITVRFGPVFQFRSICELDHSSLANDVLAGLHGRVSRSSIRRHRQERRRGSRKCNGNNGQAYSIDGSVHPRADSTLGLSPPCGS